MAGKHRNHTESSLTHRLSIGVVTVGLGMAVSAGQPTAFAAPSDSTAAGGSSTSSPADDQGATDKPAVKVGSRAGEHSAASTASPDVTTHRSTSKTPITHGDKIKKRLPDQIKAGAEDASGGDSAAVSQGVPGADVAVAAEPEAPSAVLPVEQFAAPDAEPATASASRDLGKANDADGPASLTVAGKSGPSHAAAAPEAASVVATDAVTREVPVSAVATAHIAGTQVTATNPPAPSRLVSVAETPKTPAAPVTLASIVTDVLTWVGLGPLANHLPVPALPVGHLIEAMWLAVREVHDRFSGRPVANSVVAAAPLNISDLLARPGVSVTPGADGAVDVINGRFTEATVNSAADAAQVFNGLASVLGAPAGFASPEAITVQRIEATEPGDIAETFYRLNASVAGIPVLGSDVVLATDGNGQITGLFNYRDPRIEGMDLTADRRVDARFEAITLAAAAYLKSVGRPQDLLSTLVFMAFSKFDPQMVVYAGGADAAPQLAWRVVVAPPQPLLAPPPPAAMYYINANGANAAKVMLSVSAAQPLTSVPTAAKDVLGQTRVINVAQQSFLFFQSYKMQDLTRNLLTYKTKYGFFGMGPYVPSSPLSKGWFGWNAEAVSAQANAAQVYDYYQSVLGLTSINGAGGPVKLVVAYNPVASWSGKYNNAYWDANTKQLVFGDGADLEAALDVVGHEYTHAVVSYILGNGGPVLDYGEPGSLNEAFADLIGSIIEGKTDAGRWLIGENSTYPGGVVRNIANPGAVNTASGPYRVTYADRYIGNDDEAGEHVNSTIFSHAMYKAMTDPATSAITSATWAKLFYHSIYRLSTTSTFTNGRAAIVATASTPEFAFTPGQLAAINKAFDDAGIVAPAPVATV